MKSALKFWSILDGFFKLKKCNSSVEIIDSGTKKIGYIKKLLSIFFIFICYYSIEQCSPGDYSFYNSVSVAVNKKYTKPKPTVDDVTQSASDKINQYTVKTGVLLAITFIFYLQLNIFDATRDQNKLRAIINKKYHRTILEKYIFRSKFDDIKKYALCLASNNIENLCNRCVHKKCRNKINEDELLEKHSYLLWRDVYYNTNASTDATENLVRASLYVRFIIYLKILIINSIIIISIAWIFHRVIELYIGDSPMYFSQAVVVLLLMASVYLILINMGKNRKNDHLQALTGVWSNFEENGKIYFRSAVNQSHLEASYKESICARKNGIHKFTPIATPEELNTSITIDLYSVINENINDIVIKKLALIMEESTKTDEQHLIYIDYIIKSLKDLFDKNFPGQGQIQAYHLNAINDIENYCAISDKNKDKLGDILIKYGKYCCGEKDPQKLISPSNFRSFLLYGVDFDGDDLRYLKSNISVTKKSSLNIVKNLGFILLASESGDFFSGNRSLAMYSIVKGYALRVAYEIIRQRIGDQK